MFHAKCDDEKKARILDFYKRYKDFKCPHLLSTNREASVKTREEQLTIIADKTDTFDESFLFWSINGTPITTHYG